MSSLSHRRLRETRTICQCVCPAVLARLLKPGWACFEDPVETAVRNKMSQAVRAYWFFPPRITTGRIKWRQCDHVMFRLNAYRTWHGCYAVATPLAQQCKSLCIDVSILSVPDIAGQKVIRTCLYKLSVPDVAKSKFMRMRRRTETLKKQRF